MAQAFQPYLSVVAASRNDDHGGDPLRRTQIFINCFARQCEKHRLPAELILVDWNPVPDRPSLAAVLQLPPESAYCQARVITVPAELHQRIKYADKLPFFQMIAKNAGIRRARGRFVLATNIDIVFSDELVAFLARQQLDPSKQYRVDRYDIEAGLSENLTLDETLDYAWAHPIRQHKRFAPAALAQHLYGGDAIRRVCTPDPEVIRRIGGVTLRDDAGVWLLELERAASMEHMHTNACGDFTLLAREAWEAIRGYPEFEAFSFNIDSMGLVAAHYAGYTEVTLLPPCVCFHIEHSLGSGWTPQGEKKLFQRLRQANILNPEWPVLIPMVEEMRHRLRALEFNHTGWGLADFTLPEQPLGATEPLRAFVPPELPYPVAAIRAPYDLDRRTLVHERQLAASRTGSDDMEDIVQLFWPDAQGGYSEENCSLFRGVLRESQTVAFQPREFSWEHPLRLDPVARNGLVEIINVTVLDVGSSRKLASWDGRDVAQMATGGTAQMFTSGAAREGAQSLHVLSTGDDPQIYFPRLHAAPRFPVIVLLTLRFFPS